MSIQQADTDLDDADLERRIAELRVRFPRVALAHDWLTIPGGSEQVVIELLDLFPSAEIFTTVYDPEPWPAAIRERPVHTSFLQRIPRATSIYPKLLPLMARAFESFDLSRFDLVISSSHACAKNVIVPAGVPHVCYCHTPMRYAWEPEFLDGEEIGRATRLALPLLLAHLRRRDLAGAGRPTVYVANSEHVAARIKRFYGRDSLVVHPTVDVERFLALEHVPEDYYLVFGRVVPYKRADLAVAACAQLGRRVKVAGDGRALGAVRAVAGPETELLGRVSDEQLSALLRGARAMLFCAEEDFGIVPVEAQAAGVPVIAYGVGGAGETVRDGQTGVLYDAQTPQALSEAILRFESLTFEDRRLREHAAQFSAEHFRAGMVSAIELAAATSSRDES
jgi:glycosyltransferase involved in cell wall biosynthesis